MKICARCKEKVVRSNHAITKYCFECKEILKKNIPPPKYMSEYQKDFIRKNANKMSQVDIAKSIGLSESAVKRFAKLENLSLKNTQLYYTPQEIEMVCKYYEKHKGRKTQEKFPNMCVRSIIERHYKKLKFKPLASKWQPDQIHEAAKMAGLVGFNAQAKFFNRPNAYNGSIRSFYVKKMNASPNSINTLPKYLGVFLVRYNCPFYVYKAESYRTFCFWVDAAKHLKQNITEEQKKIITVMAKFQDWLHEGNYPGLILERHENFGGENFEQSRKKTRNKNRVKSKST